MMVISKSNIDENVFYKFSELQTELPQGFKVLYDQWRLGKNIDVLSDLVEKSRLQALALLAKQGEAELKKIFGKKVFIESCEEEQVSNISISTLEPCLGFKKKSHLLFCVTRKKDFGNILMLA